MEVNNRIFNSFPKEIVSQIVCSVDDFEALKVCETVCKLWNRSLASIENYKIHKEDFFARKVMPELALFPPALINILGGKKKICQLPILTLKNDGVFGYIDWLEPKDLSGHKICRGIDKYNRPFITFGFQQFLKSPFLFGNNVKTMHKISKPSLTDDNVWVIGAGNRACDFELEYLNDINTMENYRNFSRLKELFLNGRLVDEHGLTVLGASSLLPRSYDVFQFLHK